MANARKTKLSKKSTKELKPALNIKSTGEGTRPVKKIRVADIVPKAETINIKVTPRVEKPPEPAPKPESLITGVKPPIEPIDFTLPTAPKIIVPPEEELMKPPSAPEPNIIDTFAIKKAQEEARETKVDFLKFGGADGRRLEQQTEDFEKREIERFGAEDEIKRRKRFAVKTYVLLSSLFLILAAGVFAATEFLPKANIKITTKKIEWRYVDSVAAKRTIAEIDTTNKSIPAEIFSKRNNSVFPFPATGKKYIERKATGNITIYNAYSSDPQPLVATTRFLAPDGKIFRLTKGLTVPGAKIVDGKIVPSSIEAAVTADKAGTEYNISPVERFYVPGFKGTPKYDSFYAESKTAMSGGFVGQAPFPTDQDIKNGEAQATKSLKESIDSLLRVDISAAFQVIDGSSQFNILKKEVVKDVDEKGNFSIFLDAESSVITFREADLLKLMKVLANNDLKPQSPVGTADYEVKSFKAEYGSARMDVKQGQISFALNFTGSFEVPPDIPSFTQNAMGKKETDLRNLIYSLPNVEKATIAFWPFWVKTVPDKPSRVQIEVE